LILDGAKALYPDILGLVESRLRLGTLIVADNADYAPDYLAPCAHPGTATSPLPGNGFAVLVEILQTRSLAFGEQHPDEARNALIDCERRIWAAKSGADPAGRHDGHGSR
jgi:hypothetical protein